MNQIENKNKTVSVPITIKCYCHDNGRPHQCKLQPNTPKSILKDLKSLHSKALKIERKIVIQSHKYSIRAKLQNLKIQHDVYKVIIENELAVHDITKNMLVTQLNKTQTVIISVAKFLQEKISEEISEPKVNHAESKN